MKKKMGKKGLWVFLVLTGIAAVYMGFAIFFESHFSFGTTIDGISVGGRSAAGVKQLIEEEIRQYSLTIQGREGASGTIDGSSISLAPVFQGEVERLLAEQKGYQWIAALFAGNELELKQSVSYDEDALYDEVLKLGFMDSKKQRAPSDATYSDYDSESGYTLVPADYGTKINEQALREAVADAVLGLEETLDIDQAGCYEEPAIADDDEELKTLLADLNRYVGTVITYEFGDRKEILDAETIHTWLKDENGRIAVDEEAVLSYVKTLAKKYNTAYQPKELETSYGATVTISNGFYGWRIDNAGEVEQILADLESGESITREPVYAQRANSHGANDYGDSYVEINLTAQHLFLYKDGALIVESDFVSGNLAKGHATPTGAFGLTYKTTDAVLRGEDYATPVKYWMPYAGDVGMHDATWRKSFGSNIYKTNGSHGCINLPRSAAKTIYETIEQGYPVLVYTLPGTESEAVQKADAENVVQLINSIGTVTLESETAIVSARTLYNALSDTAKGYVTNIDTLTAAEAALAQLKAQQPQPPATEGPPQPPATEGQPQPPTAEGQPQPGQ